MVQLNVTSLVAEYADNANTSFRVDIMVMRECRYSSIAGTYVVPKAVSIQEPSKGKTMQPQEWKAVVGKMPAASAPKLTKAAPATNSTAISKNAKGGSSTTAVARKPLVSRN
jgi:hypothetical protein